VWIVLVNAAAWLVIQLGLPWLFSRIPLAWFDPSWWLFRTRAWEREGRVYDRLFFIRAWKRSLPDGAALFRNGFRKRRMRTRSPVYCSTFVRETCRAESLHWLLLAVSALFFIWNRWDVATLMIPYGIVVNAPCIVVQRFNRPRLTRLATRGMPQAS
jgi:glycosyl-4,4'-diaponeurosporenoate acyltransferase